MSNLFDKSPLECYKAGTNISIAAKAIEREAHDKMMGQSMSTCFRCDKATRLDKVLTGKDIPFIGSEVKILHDVEFGCKLLNSNISDWRMCCTAGTKIDRKLRCSGCAFGIHGIQAEKVPIKTHRNSEKSVRVSQVLYQCSCAENAYTHAGEYCTGYFLCANYKEKDVT